MFKARSSCVRSVVLAVLEDRVCDEAGSDAVDTSIDLDPERH